MLFFSYRRHDLDRAKPLLDALASAGISVWRDVNEIPPQGSITAEIRKGIAGSHALLAFYSRTYPESNPCQQEITTAWLAAQQIDAQNPGARVWIFNPETSFEHIPQPLRNQQAASADAGTLAKSLQALGVTLLGNGIRPLPEYHGMSPVQARTFVGRVAEMWDLHGKLTANRTSIISGVYGQSAAQISGLGGTGKSLLAREYSIRFGPAFPGGVFWLNAGALRQDQVRDFAIRIGVSIEGLKPDEIEASFWQTLEQRREPCLWIADDVPAGLAPQDLQRNWYARWPGAATLVTTRSKEYGSLGTTLDLNVLSNEEARTLLKAHRPAQSSADENAARKIVDLLGAHPLAIDVAGGYLAQGVQDYESYAADLENPNDDAAEYGSVLKESLPTGHERSISATLLKSIRQLGPEGLDFLRVASVLAAAPIPVNLISEVFDRVNGHDKLRALKGINQAESLSLTDRAGDQARSVHALVSRTMHFQFPKDPRTLELRSAAVQTLKERLKRIGSIAEYSKIVPDIPHARHLTAAGPMNIAESELAAWLAHRDEERGDYTTALRLQQSVVEFSRRELGENDAATLRAKSNLGKTLYSQGNLKAARAVQEWVLPARMTLLGPKHPDTLVSLNNLAEILRAQGDLAGARKLQEQVVAGRRHPPGQETPDQLTAMNNLAQTLSQQGDFAEARRLQEFVLQGTRRLAGDKHPHTLSSMLNLALTLKSQNELAAARKLEEQVVAIIPDVLGPHHRETLNAKNNLAQTLYLQDDFKGARKLQDEVLEGLHHILGDDHPNTLWAMNNLANTMFMQGERAEGIELAQRVVEGRSRVLGENHPDTVAARKNLDLMRSVKPA